MVLYVRSVLLVELAIVARAVVKVTRLAHQHRAEIVTDEQLSSVEQGKRCICKQTHSPHEFHQVKLFVHGDLSFRQHAFVQGPLASKLLEKVLLFDDLGPVEIPRQLGVFVLLHFFDLLLLQLLIVVVNARHEAEKTAE